MVVLLPPFHHFHYFYHFQRSTCCFLRKRSNALGTMFQRPRNNILRPEKHCVLLPYFFNRWHRLTWLKPRLFMIKQIGFAYQSAASAAEIHRNLCNGMNNAQPKSVSSAKSVVKNTCEYHFSGKKCRFFITFSSFFYRFSVTFRHFSVDFSSFLPHFHHFYHLSTTISTTIKLSVSQVLKYESGGSGGFFSKKFWVVVERRWKRHL